MLYKSLYTWNLTLKPRLVCERNSRNSVKRSVINPRASINIEVVPPIGMGRMQWMSLSRVVFIFTHSLQATLLQLQGRF